MRVLVAMLTFALAPAVLAQPDVPIKAFCVDFNWGPGGENGFAPPGLWADADPKAHVDWYAALGANTIQTFAVSCNGYAWYKNGLVPEQPGLKSDFLPEMVRLGHARGMKVMGYFCIGSNTRWGKEHPEYNYGAPSSPHIVYADAYLDFLAASISDALTKTGMDGFMIDWVWMPDGIGDARKTAGGNWLDAEKTLYEHLMNAPFPGENKLTPTDKTAYDRACLDRLWKRIHDAAKASKPDCVIWLSCCDLAHPSVAGSPMLREVDWLMNEHPDPVRLAALLDAAPKGQRIIQCLVGWGDQHDARAVLTNPARRVQDIYGFAKPDDKTSLPLPVAEYLAKPLNEFQGNDKNIAVLGRFYNEIKLK